MLFWALAILTAIFSLARFKPLRNHLGTTQAVAIFALRLFAIAIAALLFSPISISFSRKVTQPNQIAVLVDSSQSVNTSVRHQVVRRLKQALQKQAGSVLVWEFGEDLKPVSLNEISSQTDGSASLLSEAILKVVEKARPEELLIITDSQDTAPRHERLLETLRRTGTRLSAIILPTNLPTNLSISLSPTQSFLFAGEKANFTVRIRGERLRGRTSAHLRVWRGNKLVFQSPLKFVNGVAQTDVSLSPEKSGWHRYRFEVLPVEGEIWTEDNDAEVLVWQAPTKLRVLLVTGQPNFEFKFAKRAVESEPNFEMVSVASLPDRTRYQQGSPKLMPASLTNPEKFHVAVIIAPTADEFGVAEGRGIWQFVQSGGGLLLTLNELSIRTNGWRFFMPYSLAFVPLPPLPSLLPVREEPVGNQLSNLPKVDVAWAIGSLPSSAHPVLLSFGKPVLVWWQEGLGKVAIVAFDGTWRWVMEAASKGKQPEIHQKFWLTLLRFLADPMKGEKVKMSNTERDLKTPKPPPSELSLPPDPKPVENWAKATGGKVLKPEDLEAWVKELSWKRTVKIQASQPISAMPLPYLLLLLALTIEWWLIRRSGLT